MSKVIPAMSRAFFDTQMVTARLMLGASEFLWAVLLLWPGDTFDRPTYKIMSHVMPEDCWGLLFLVTSVLQFSIVVKENFHSREARYFAFYNMILWTFVVLSMLASVYPPPAAISGEMVLAIAAGWIWVRPILMCRLILKARSYVRYKM